MMKHIPQCVLKTSKLEHFFTFNLMFLGQPVAWGHDCFINQVWEILWNRQIFWHRETSSRGQTKRSRLWTGSVWFLFDSELLMLATHCWVQSPQHARNPEQKAWNPSEVILCRLFLRAQEVQDLLVSVVWLMQKDRSLTEKGTAKRLDCIVSGKRSWRWKTVTKTQHNLDLLHFL